MGQCLSSRPCEKGPGLCNIAKVVKGGFDNLTGMRFKEEGGIKDHAKIACLRGRGDSGAISVGLWNLLKVDLVPMSSVLSLLSLRKFCCIQSSIADRQESM